MGRVLLLVVLMLCPSLSHAAYWDETFENHLYPNWISDSTACISSINVDSLCYPKISNTKAHAGTYSLYTNFGSTWSAPGVQAGTYNDRYHTLTNDVWERMWFYQTGFAVTGGRYSKIWYQKATDMPAGGPPSTQILFGFYDSDTLNLVAVQQLGSSLIQCSNYGATGGFDADCAYHYNVGSKAVTNDAWHCIETHTRMNSVPGTGDGVLEVWVDNVKVMEYFQVMYKPAPTANVQWERDTVFAQYGQGQRWIDDWAVSATRIGCPGGTADTTPPSAPSALQATASGAQISLTFTGSTDNIGVTNYTIERCSGVSCSTFTTLTALTPPTVSYINTGLTASTSYSYRVRASDAAGNFSPYSATATATTGSTFRTTLATDTFNRANSTELGASWQPGYTGNGPLQIVSNQLRPTALNTDALETYVITTPNDQFAQFTLAQVSGSGVRAPRTLVRFSDPANINGYECGFLLPTTFRCGEWNAGVFTQKTSDTFTAQAGDIVRTEAEGTTIRGYVVRAGVETLINSFTDATHTAGKTGIIHYQNTGTLGDVQVDDFVMGSISATPPTPPSITRTIADATGATLTHGGVTATTIRVIRGNESGTFNQSVLVPIASFPAGRYTFDWEDGLDFVCFYPRDAAGVENVEGGSCDSLTEWVGALDQAAIVLSNGQPTGTLPAGTTTATISATLDKAGACRYDTTDIAYASMVNQMSIAGPTASASVGSLTDGSVTPLFVRCNFVNAFDEEYPNLTSLPITVRVASAADVTPPTITSGPTTINLAAGSTSTVLAVSTNENGTCKGGVIANTVYAAQANTFAGTGTKSHTHTLSGLTDGSTTLFYVRCTDGTNPTLSDYTFTVEVTALPPDVTPPTITSILPVANQAAGTTNVDMSYTSDEAATCKYSLIPGTAFASMTALSTTGGTSHLQNIASLQDNTTYSYWNKCQDAAGNTTPDFLVTWYVAIAPGDTTPPADVTNVVATALLNSQAGVVFTAATDDVLVSGYNLYLSTDDSTYTFTAFTATASATLTGLAPSTAYYVKVKAVDSSGNLSANYSAAAPFTTSGIIDITPPSYMAGLRIIAAFTGSLLLGWDMGADDRGSVTTTLEYCVGAACSPTTVYRSKIATQDLSVELASGTAHCFRGKHSDQAGNTGGYSETVCGTTLTSGLSIPRVSIPFGQSRTAITTERTQRQ